MPAPFLDPNLATAAMAALAGPGVTGGLTAQPGVAGTTLTPATLPAARVVGGTRVVTQQFLVTRVGAAKPEQVTVIQLLPEPGAVDPRFKKVPAAVTCPTVVFAVDKLPLGAVAQCVPIPPAALAVKPVVVSPLQVIGLKVDP